MSDEILILLSQYIHGELSPEKKAALEARIQQEPALAEALREYTLGEQAIQAKGDQLLKEKLNQKGISLLQKNPPKSKVLWPWIAAAAAIALLISVFLFNTSSPGPQWQEMAEAFPLPNAPTSIRGNSDLPKLRQKGTDSYLRLQNQEAATYWNQYLQDTTDIEIQFYLGIVYWQMGNPDSAQYHLSQVPQESSLYQRASWYQTAVCVDKKDTDCLKTHLNSISQQNGHYKQSTAQDWLKDLE